MDLSQRVGTACGAAKHDGAFQRGDRHYRQRVGIRLGEAVGEKRARQRRAPVGENPSGLGGQLVLPFSLWLMKRTMLGNPFIKPWNDLAAIADDFEMEEFLFGSWYVCRGTKSAGAQSYDLLPAERLLAAE